MKKTSLLYKIIKAIVRFFIPRYDVFGEDYLPDEPCIIVANHCQMYGPICCEIFFPGNHYTWCASEMMHTSQVPAYAYSDFWSKKPVYIRWFFRIASYVIAPLASHIFNNANCIGVYRGPGIRKTLKETLEKLDEGARVIIFPEHDGEYDHIINEFQDRFIDLAEMYYRRTGKQICFVPMYIAPYLNQMHIGKPIRFNASAGIREERLRIRNTLMEEISDMAQSLPLHRIVPYRQTSKRKCPDNISGRPYGRLRKPVIDYRQLRPRLLFGDSRFSHLRLLGGWIVYFILYMLTEKLIPESACHVVHCALDDMIPFNEYFLIFYCAWYFWIILTLLYFLAYDIDGFKRLQTFFIIVQAAAMVVYILYPTIQLGRPESFARDNIFTHIMALIYNFDTPTGVCPSLHVAYSIGIAEAWVRCKQSSPACKTFMVLLCVMVSISVVFVKQHSAIDIVAALPLAVIANFLLYGRVSGRKTRLQKALDRI